jgi:hypothetical protein
MTSYLIEFKWDDECDVWYAVNNDIPLALESGSLDVLMERVKFAVPEILELNSIEGLPELHFSAERVLVAELPC